MVLTGCLGLIAEVDFNIQISLHCVQAETFALIRGTFYHPQITGKYHFLTHELYAKKYRFQNDGFVIARVITKKA